MTKTIAVTINPLDLITRGVSLSNMDVLTTVGEGITLGALKQRLEVLWASRIIIDPKELDAFSRLANDEITSMISRLTAGDKNPLTVCNRKGKLWIKPRMQDC